MPPAPASARRGALAALPEESPANLPSGAANEHLPLAELASGEAVLERIVSSRDLPRLQALCRSAEGIQARLSFAWDQAGPVRIDGALTTRLAMQCHRCLEAVPVHLRSAFSVLAVADEAEASRLGAERDVLAHRFAEAQAGRTDRGRAAAGASGAALRPVGLRQDAVDGLSARRPSGRPFPTTRSRQLKP